MPEGNEIYPEGMPYFETKILDENITTKRMTVFMEPGKMIDKTFIDD